MRAIERDIFKVLCGRKGRGVASRRNWFVLLLGRWERPLFHKVDGKVKDSWNKQGLVPATPSPTHIQDLEMT